MNREKRQRILIFVFVILLTCLLYLRDLGGYNINKYILLAIAVLFAVVLDRQRLLYLISFIFPLSCGLPSNYIFPILALCLLYKSDNRYFKISLLACFCFCVIGFAEIIHLIPYPGEINNAELVGYLFALFLLFYLISTDDIKTDYAVVALYFSIGVCLLLLCIYLNFDSLIDDSATMMDLESVRIGDVSRFKDVVEREMALQTNANNIGLYSITAISVSLALYYYKKINLFVFLPIVFISFFCGVASISRTWMLLLGFSIVLYLVLQRHSFAKNTIIVLAFITGIYFYFSLNQMVLDAFKDRFTDANFQTAGGRSYLFAAYNDFLFSHPKYLWFGTGALYYKEVCQIYHSIHNSFQQILVSYGIGGFILFMSLYLGALKKYYVKKEYMALLPMLCVTIFLQSLQFLNPKYEMYPLIAAFFIMRMVKSDAEYGKIIKR